MTEEKTWKGENQLHTASLVYGDLGSFFKQNIIIAASSATEAWSGQQNAYLREASASVEWETNMLRGGWQEHMLETVKSISVASKYGSMGIECSWPKLQSLTLHDPRVVSSDDHAALLWDLCFLLVRHRRQRLLHLTDGYPRRLLLNQV
jgi:hypothetical protein